jgi:steroid delta-isomerase-like uncharacterized protein
MSTETNKAIVRRLLEESTGPGADRVIDELVASNFRTHEGEEAKEVGIEGFKQLAASFRTAFADGKFVIEDMVAEGDKVVTWAHFIGTHTGPLEGMPPTGQRVKVKDVDLFRLENGKVVETWTHFDQLGMMHQLGMSREAGEEH